MKNKEKIQIMIGTNLKERKKQTLSPLNEKFPEANVYIHMYFLMYM